LNHALLLRLTALLIVVGPPALGAQPIETAKFELLMNRLAAGWNEENARKAADCFTENAIYSEPPAKQFYRGREALFQFFGRKEGRKGAMKMSWHHLIFNEQKQIGAGEFTFVYGSKVHVVAIIKIERGKISNWREYWYESTLDWEKFIGENRF
jgi:hypothetical protein